MANPADGIERGTEGGSNSRVLMVLLVLLAVASTAWAITFRLRSRPRVYDLSNYDIDYPQQIPGWKSLPVTFRSFAVFKQERSGALLRAGVSHTVGHSDNGPGFSTDELTAGLIVGNAYNRGWSDARQLGSVDAHGTAFNLIHRKGPTSTVVDAIASKGNDVWVIVLEANGPSQRRETVIASALPDFKRFLASIRFSRTWGGQL